MEGSGAGPESVLVTNGSGCGSGRPKHTWILRIRIPNSACTFVDVLNAVLHVHNPALDLLLKASVVLHNVVLVFEALLFQGLSLLLQHKIAQFVILVYDKISLYCSVEDP